MRRDDLCRNLGMPDIVTGIEVHWADGTCANVKCGGESNTSILPTERPAFIRVAIPQADRALEGFLPLGIEIDGVRYHRHLDEFYLPNKPRPDGIRRFFDYLGHSYDAICDLELNKDVIRMLLRHIGIDRCTKDVRLLDFGCGPGTSLPVLNKKWKKRRLVTLTGVDLSYRMLHMALKASSATDISGAHFLQCDYACIPCRSRTFDLGFAAYVVHYFMDSRPFAEIARVLRPGAAFAFNVHKPRKGWDQTYQRMLQDAGLLFSKTFEEKIDGRFIRGVVATKPS